MGEIFSFKSATEDDLSGHLERPAGNGPWPGVLVVQEWWGLVPHIKDVAARFAKLGYLALAPDLYLGEFAEDADGAMRLTQQHGPAAGERLQAAYRPLRDHPDCTGKVGAVGYCFGGRMVLHLACHEIDLDAAAIYYSGRMEQYFDRVKNIRCPVLGLYGGEDGGIPAKTVKEFDSLLDATGVPHEVVIYPGAAHAFFNDTGSNYHAPSAADAWKRTTQFFDKYLKG
ncbi:MAG: dienelactone hydrolase family protein [Chloroflexi bacterium]|nr:dienelactone hydrolase family protein [Chloroflexota bacterium]